MTSYTPRPASLAVHLRKGFKHELSKAIEHAVQGALKEANIVPSKDSVSTDDFLNALTTKFGFTPILFCDEDRSGNKYIDSVRCLLLPMS